METLGILAILAVCALSGPWSPLRRKRTTGSSGAADGPSTAPARTPTVGGSPREFVVSVEQLEELRKKGVLTDEECADRKGTLIEGLRKAVHTVAPEEFLTSLMPLLEQGALTKDEVSTLKDMAMPTSSASRGHRPSPSSRVSQASHRAAVLEPVLLPSRSPPPVAREAEPQPVPVPAPWTRWKPHLIAGVSVVSLVLFVLIDALANRPEPRAPKAAATSEQPAAAPVPPPAPPPPAPPQTASDVVHEAATELRLLEPTQTDKLTAIRDRATSAMKEGGFKERAWASFAQMIKISKDLAAATEAPSDPGEKPKYEAPAYDPPKQDRIDPEEARMLADGDRFLGNMFAASAREEQAEHRKALREYKKEHAEAVASAKEHYKSELATWQQARREWDRWRKATPGNKARAETLLQRFQREREGLATLLQGWTGAN